MRENGSPSTKSLEMSLVFILLHGLSFEVGTGCFVFKERTGENRNESLNQSAICPGTTQQMLFSCEGVSSIYVKSNL